MNPHFLFNSLNTLVSEIEYNPVNAIEFTRNLADTYRYILYCQDKHTVELNEELQFLDTYVLLRKVRLGDCLQVDNRIADKFGETPVPPLSLQQLVEKVIKHNVISMKKPKQCDFQTTAAAHTLEHLFATYARNSAFQDGVIYVGPMGCRTGFYLLTRGLTPAQALELTVESFRFMAAFEGAVPGASEVECGNYRDMDLPAAKAEAAAMLPVLEALTADRLHY